MATSLRSPLGRVRGHGAAGGGTDHHITERVGWIALWILIPFCLVSLILADDFSYDGLFAWLRQPWNAVAMALLSVALLQNLRLMMQVVVEDYVDGSMRSLLLVANFFVSVGLTVFALWSIAAVSFGAA